MLCDHATCAGLWAVMFVCRTGGIADQQVVNFGWHISRCPVILAQHSKSFVLWLCLFALYQWRKLPRLMESAY